MTKHLGVLPPQTEGNIVEFGTNGFAQDSGFKISDLMGGGGTSGSSNTFTNGLTNTLGTVTLGGNLNQGTTINGTGGENFTFSNIPTFNVNNVLFINDDNSFSIGSGSSVGDSTNVAIGLNANASGVDAIAIGHDADATGANAINIGDDTSVVSQADAIGIGRGTQASGQRGICIGFNTDATALNSIAIGSTARSTQQRAISIGDSANSFSSFSIAIGEGAVNGASSNTSIAIGRDAINNLNESIAIGTVTETNNSNAIAIGNELIINGQRGIGIGLFIQVDGLNSVVLGSGEGPSEYVHDIADSFAVIFDSDKPTIELNLSEKSYINSNSGLVIGEHGTSANVDTILELESTNKAFLPPRLNNPSVDVSTPINGMIAYSTSTNKLQVYASGAWVDLH